MSTVSNDKYPENHISQTTVRQIFNKFEEHCLISAANLSMVPSAQNNAAPIRAIKRFFKTEEYHSYKVYLVQEMVKDTMTRCLQFCEEMMRRCSENNEFPHTPFG